MMFAKFECDGAFAQKPALFSSASWNVSGSRRRKSGDLSADPNQLQLPLFHDTRCTPGIHPKCSFFLITKCHTFMICYTFY